MMLRDAVGMALRTIRTQKLKSFFSLLGVLIGVTFLIAVVSIVQGMNVYMEDQFANKLVGLNTFQLRRMPNFTDASEEQWREWSRRPRINYAEADFVEARMETPAIFSRFCSEQLPVMWNGTTAKSVDVWTADAPMFRIKNLDVESGRVFSPQEAEAGVSVVVIGWEIAEKLFKGADPIGKDVAIEGLPYRVIGRIAKQGTLFGFSLDKFVVVPFNSPVHRAACRSGFMDELHVRADNVVSMKAAVAETQEAMRIQRRLKPQQDDNFAMQTAEGALEGWNKISAILMKALPMLVSVSLVVGGIVIMNIMLMAVAERTVEIGIRKALGAKRRDILAQFVVESATLSTVGAGVGILTGIGLAFTVRSLTPLPAAVAPWSVVLGVSLGVAVGMIAGIYPASRASRLDPITALRAE
jgi:putative ABC transport system permease protein